MWWTWDELREAIESIASRLVRYSYVRSTTDDGHGDGTAGEGDASDTENVIYCRRAYPAGFDARPVAGTEAITVASRGGRTNEAMIGNPRQGNAPAVAEGEAVVYSPTAPTARLLFDKDGNIKGDAASGKDIIINGGSASVGRVGDSCLIKSAASGGALAVWMGQVEVALNTLAGGSVTTLSTAIVASPGISIKDGAAHLKA